MGGSGVQELFGVVYADNTLGYMPSGKATSRAVRGHLLTDAALNTMLAAKALGIDAPQVDPEQDIPQQYSEEDEFHDKPQIMVIRQKRVLSWLEKQTICRD
jgi:hypothetical protein